VPVGGSNNNKIHTKLKTENLHPKIKKIKNIIKNEIVLKLATRNQFSVNRIPAEILAAYFRSVPFRHRTS